jgi:hypothetical protein
MTGGGECWHEWGAFQLSGVGFSSAGGLFPGFNALGVRNRSGALMAAFLHRRVVF